MTHPACDRLDRMALLTVALLTKNMQQRKALKIVRDLQPGETMWRYICDDDHATRASLTPMETYEGTVIGLTRFTDVMPDWFDPIRDAADIGGHFTAPAKPPPTKVLWFITDANDQLVEFISFDR